ncbi:MAG: N-acetyltransferase [Novosphingobium sp.]|uniref:GNAT family N-acetyltransferase n=1 Tax=Novosphingobium sp. TaxID=1874826 RepID=UPI0012C2DEF0|nr:GNAT family N-acetyltransferase [Novosphingobium sp.]MPS67425.1 N-acetyltransferase [Novosphingobium sp.]
MTAFRLETDRLVLRNWQPGDIARFAEVTNTPQVMRWLGGVMDAERLAASEARMLGFHESWGHTFWIAERKADGGDLSGEMLGFCGLKKIDAPGASFLGAFEIGWRLRSDSHGKGYAKEAAGASLDAGFGQFGAEEIFAITVIENEPSWGLMRRLGMRRRQELDYDDLRFEPPLRHTIVYSITCEEWAAQPR